MKNSNTLCMNALSAAADQAGPALDASLVVAASAQAVVTGTSTGTLKFQFSNDPPGSVGPTTWIDLPAASQIAIAGAGSYSIPKFDCSYQWLRLFFAHTNAAAGTITVRSNTKGF